MDTSPLPDISLDMDSKRTVSPLLNAAASTALSASLNQRRSSRSVKRKKFDDELVESSLAKTSKLLTPPLTRTEAIAAPGKVEPIFVQAPPEVKHIPIQIPLPVLPQPKKTQSKSKASKRHRKPKPPVIRTVNDLGRWRATDDIALITAVQQTCDLKKVHMGVKFACKFTLKEIQERWYALLYDPIISKLALSAMQMCPPDLIANVQSKALYSKKEETILGAVTSTSQPNLEVFEKLLDENISDFYPSRTPKALYNHWLLMKQYHLLPDQSVQPMPKGDHVLNFSDAEDMINDDELLESKDPVLEHELSVADRRQKREIRHLEEEIPKWQVLVDSVTGISPPDFDNQTLAVLRGRLVRYLMRSREITMGRSTEDNQVDVDLSLEGPAWKVSRKQGMIKLKGNGDFFIINEGKRPIYVDGRPVLPGTKQKLCNNAVVEISCLRFIFLINQDLINAIKTESQKMNNT